METDEQLRARLIAQVRDTAVAGALATAPPEHLDYVARVLRPPRVTWVPSEHLEVTNDGRVIQHGEFCSCAGTDEYVAYRDTVCSHEGFRHGWRHSKPRLPEGGGTRQVILGRLALFATGLRRLHTVGVGYAAELLGAASDAPWPVCSNLIEEEGIQTNIEPTLTVFKEGVDALRTELTKPTMCPRCGNSPEQCELCFEAMQKARASLPVVIYKHRQPGLTGEPQPAMLQDPPYAREPAGDFPITVEVRRRPKCPVCGSKKHGLIFSSRMIAPLAHAMLDEQIKTGGGHDGEEAIMRCFHRLRDHWDIVQRLERDLDLVEALGPCFAVTPRDEVAF